MRTLTAAIGAPCPRSADFTEFAVTVEQSGFDVLAIPDHLAEVIKLLR